MRDREKKVLRPNRARDLSVEDRRKVIKQLECGSALSDLSLARLAESSCALDFRRRRFVYRAGDPADALLAIVHGRIKLCRIEQNSGREAVIDILSAGSLFG